MDSVMIGQRQFFGRSYCNVVEALLSDPSVSHELKARIRADQLRDPVDAQTDSAILAELCAMRVEEMFDGYRVNRDQNAHAALMEGSESP